MIVTLKLIHLHSIVPKNKLFYNKVRKKYEILDRVPADDQVYESVGMALMDGDRLIVEGVDKFKYAHILAVTNGRLKNGDRVIVHMRINEDRPVVNSYGQISFKHFNPNNMKKSPIEMLLAFGNHLSDEAGRELCNRRSVVEWFENYTSKS